MNHQRRQKPIKKKAQKKKDYLRPWMGGCKKLSCHVALLHMAFMNDMMALAPRTLTSLHSCNKEGIMNVEQGLGLHQLLGLTQLLNRHINCLLQIL